MGAATTLPDADLAKFLDNNPDTMIRLGVADTDGVVRGKFIDREKLLSGIGDGLSICDCVLGWDVADSLYDDPRQQSTVGWRFGFPDAPVRIVRDSLRLIEEQNGKSSIWAVGEFAGTYEALCPRSVLRRIVSRAAASGYAVKCGFEYEFTLFREDSCSLREKGFRNLEPLTQGNFGYSILKTTVLSGLFGKLHNTLSRSGLSIEGLHTENGPGIWEVALSPSDALRAADNAALLKIAVKQFASDNGLTACFMAKLAPEHQGQGGHIHLSLSDRTGNPCFFNHDEPDRPNPTLINFIGGQQHLMPEITAMAAPTINSYRRLIPGTWAPTVATWGIDNRTCALRVVGGTPGSVRVEYRLPGADANPYLALAAALGSGLHGIDHGIAASEPVTGNSYGKSHDENLRLPTDLFSSAQRLAGSAASRSLFGDTFVDHFVMTREWECEQFSRHVSDWELARYAEII